MVVGQRHRARARRRGSTRRVTRTLQGTEITKNGSEDCPGLPDRAGRRRARAQAPQRGRARVELGPVDDWPSVPEALSLYAQGWFPMDDLDRADEPLPFYAAHERAILPLDAASRGALRRRMRRALRSRADCDLARDRSLRGGARGVRRAARGRRRAVDHAAPGPAVPAPARGRCRALLRARARRRPGRRGARGAPGARGDARVDVPLRARRGQCAAAAAARRARRGTRASSCATSSCRPITRCASGPR